MDREELIRKYAGTERDFTGQRFGVGLTDQIIRGGIYSRTNFNEGFFESSSFIEVDLSFADFSLIRMYESSFMNCFMEGTDFTAAEFGQVIFKNVNLTKAIFRGAVFSEFDFSRTDLSYVDFRGAKDFDCVGFNDVIFYETIMPDGSIRTDNV